MNICQENPNLVKITKTSGTLYECVCSLLLAVTYIYSATTEYTAIFEWQHLQHYIVDSDMHVKNTKGRAVVFPWQQRLCKCTTTLCFMYFAHLLSLLI
jgi:hypothetical protein